VPEALSRLNFIFFDDEVVFADSLNRLCDALATDIDWIGKHTQYGEAARHWAAGGRPNGLLLRSPTLEEAEHWIASRPIEAPTPTEETQTFIRQSRQAATQRRNILTGSLAAGLVLALALAGVAYWQRGIAVEQRQIAEQQRKRAEATLAAATATANSLVFDLAQRFRNTIGIPASLIKDILDRARALQEQLSKSGEATPALKRSEAVALIETETTLLAVGDTAGALAAAQQAKQLFMDLLAGNPANTDWQDGLSVSDNKIGDVLAVQGKLEEALRAYRDGLAIVERLATADQSSTQWQLDLSVSYNKVGDVLLEQGMLEEALKAYRDSLAIRERLTAADRSNTLWQRDLSLSYEKVGDVLKAEGKLEEALKAYRDGLAIRERLAAADRSNSDWQSELSRSYGKVGDVLVAQGKLEEALKAYRDGLTIAEQQHWVAGQSVGLLRKCRPLRRRASWRRRSRPTATASPSASGSPPPIAATPGGKATCRSPTTGSATC
jgi:tetratricopeptide (TPR) repeat protein